jgi:hypothetical protein
MKAALFVGAFLAAILIALPLFALAGPGDPISGIPIGLEGDPGSVVISQTETNRAGVAVFRNVKPGKYRLIIGTIAWKSAGRGSISKQPAAVIGVSVSGQAKTEFTLTFNGQTTKTATRRFVSFAVTGNKVQTVTATIFDRWGN